MTRVRSFLAHMVLGMGLGLFVVSMVYADPRQPQGVTPADRRPRPWHPTGRDGHFVHRFPLPPGSGEALPWLRNWIEHPLEAPAPEYGGAIEGAPCTTC